MTSNKPIRHGEVLLLPVSRIPAGTRRAVRSSIVGHSETGHNHVLESTDTFWEIITNSGDMFVELPTTTPLRHKRDYQTHRALDVPAGNYRVIRKQEMDVVGSRSLDDDTSVNPHEGQSPMRFVSD